jgi:hypothetical protein
MLRPETEGERNMANSSEITYLWLAAASGDVGLRVSVCIRPTARLAVSSSAWEGDLIVDMLPLRS